VEGMWSGDGFGGQLARQWRYTYVDIEVKDSKMASR
jgi:hypothetical protein